jgi:hypothetical protein
VVRVLGYRSGGPGSIPGTTRKKSGGSGTGSTRPREYKWGATWQKSSGSCLENREYGRRDPSRWPRGTLYPQKLAITSPTRGGRSVGIVRSRTQTMEFGVSLFCLLFDSLRKATTIRLRTYFLKIKWNVSPHFHFSCPSEYTKSIPPILYTYIWIYKCCDSSVGIALGYGLDRRGTGVDFLIGERYFLLFHSVQTNCGPHPASYQMGTKGSFCGDKAVGEWSSPLAS